MLKDVKYERFIKVVSAKESDDFAIGTAVAYARLAGILAVALKYGDSVDKVNAMIEDFTKEMENK